jgi:hypothetical protein
MKTKTLLLILISVLFAALVSAQSDENKRKRLAMMAFFAGEDAYSIGRYEEALKEFQTATTYLRKADLRIQPLLILAAYKHYGDNIDYDWILAEIEIYHGLNPDATSEDYAQIVRIEIKYEKLKKSADQKAADNQLSDLKVKKLIEKLKTKPVPNLFFDQETGLIWAKSNISGYGWKGAKAYCDKLTKGGYDEWRLPDAQYLSLIGKLRFSYPHLFNPYQTFTDQRSEVYSINEGGTFKTMRKLGVSGDFICVPKPDIQTDAWNQINELADKSETRGKDKYKTCKRKYKRELKDLQKKQKASCSHLQDLQKKNRLYCARFYPFKKLSEYENNTNDIKNIIEFTCEQKINQDRLAEMIEARNHLLNLELAEIKIRQDAKRDCGNDYILRSSFKTKQKKQVCSLLYWSHYKHPKFAKTKIWGCAAQNIEPHSPRSSRYTVTAKHYHYEKSQYSSERSQKPKHRAKCTFFYPEDKSWWK